MHIRSAARGGKSDLGRIVRIGPRSYFSDDNIRSCCNWVRARRQQAFARRRRASLTDGTKPALILVEDDSSVLRALRRLMLSAGFRVIAFDRPGAVLASELPTTDACLLVDVHLPEMNGVQLCESLAASGCRLPVIMITGHLDKVTRELAQRSKAVAVLFKPFTRDSLLEAIAAALAPGKSV
jgi:CheY-like chemotaxis protein